MRWTPLVSQRPARNKRIAISLFCGPATCGYGHGKQEEQDQRLCFRNKMLQPHAGMDTRRCHIHRPEHRCRPDDSLYASVYIAQSFSKIGSVDQTTSRPDSAALLFVNTRLDHPHAGEPEIGYLCCVRCTRVSVSPSSLKLTTTEVDRSLFTRRGAAYIAILSGVDTVVLKPTFSMSTIATYLPMFHNLSSACRSLDEYLRCISGSL
nr:hypothetical protein CFP56_43808 [Quercus suber]